MNKDIALSPKQRASVAHRSSRLILNLDKVIDLVNKIAENLPLSSPEFYLAESVRNNLYDAKRDVAILLNRTR